MAHSVADDKQCECRYLAASTDSGN